MNTEPSFRKHAIAAGISLALASSLVSASAFAQAEPDADAQAEEEETFYGVARPAMPSQEPDGGIEDGGIEEVVVTGRFISGSQQLLNERMNDAFATDLLGAETISRLGDSTVGSALRRVPGLTLVQDRFVYIRGLGERYTTTLLNGAQIPSPDLTRNVVPLDIFPATVVEALRVQKAYAPSLPANFGGGMVDIRTKSIPDGFTLKLEAGIQHNTETPSRVNSYAGGGDDWLGTDDGSRALSAGLSGALNRFQGSFSDQNIQGALLAANPGINQTQLLFQTEQLRRELASNLNRDISILQKSTEPDYLLRASMGNKFVLDDSGDWEAGFSLGGQYQQQWRFTRQTTAAVGQPDEINGVAEESTRNINMFGTVNLGLSFTDEHEISTTTLWLRNTDDETEVYDFFNENRLAGDGLKFRQTRLEWEERELMTNQIRGTHRLGANTKDLLPFLNVLGFIPEDAEASWFYSQSDADTTIPNRVQIVSDLFLDENGEVVDERLSPGSTSADFRFTELEDEVENYGYDFMVPFDFGSNYVEVTAGAQHARKARLYRQTEFQMGYGTESPEDTFRGELGELFSDERLFDTIPNPDPGVGVPGSEVFVNQFEFNRQGADTNSYLAATMTDAAYGAIDWTIADTWRIAAGARWEDYRQASVPWNPYGFTLGEPQVNADFESPPESGNIPPERLAEIDSWYFQEDKVYPSLGLTYMGSLWADTFQLRLGYSETAVRPDLREITAASYIDPITGFLTRGNADVRPADVENIDLRAEWFFANSDLFSITIFDKQISGPIEFFETLGSDTTIAREIENAETASIQGVEVEWLKELGFLGKWADPFFIQGNFTYQWDRDIVIGADAPAVSCEPRDADGNALASDCVLSGASEYVFNVTLGFDSLDSKHTLSLVYNTFSERLFAYGLPGRADAFEQPFSSLDINYFFYPTDRMTFQLRAQNLLQDTIEIKRGDITTFEEDPGTNIGVRFIWGF